MTEFIKDHGGMFGLLGLVVAILALLYPLRRDRISDTAKELCDPEFLNDILGRRNQTAGTIYFASLGWLNTKANRFLGERLLGLRTIIICFCFSFIYTFFSVFLAWIALDIYKFGGLELFKTEPSLFIRTIRTVLLFAAIFLFGFLMILGFLFIFFAIILMFGISVAIGTVLITLFLVSATSGYAPLEGFGALIGILGFALGVFDGNTPLKTTITFFFLVLPVSNAMVDLASLAMTRCFLRWAAIKQSGFFLILGLGLLDTLWGLLCLLCLLYLLTLGLDLWQYLSPTTLPMDWRIYWADIRADPRQGLALWLMALTTLLPTLIHVLVGLTAMLTHASRRRVEALDELEQVCGTDRFTPARQRAIATKLVNADTYAMFLGSVFLLAAIYALWRVSELVLPYLSNWHPPVSILTTKVCLVLKHIWRACSSIG